MPPASANVQGNKCAHCQNQSRKLDVIADNLQSLVELLDDANGFKIHVEIKTLGRRLSFLDKKLDHLQASVSSMREDAKKQVQQVPYQEQSSFLPPSSVDDGGVMTTDDHVMVSQELPFNNDVQVRKFFSSPDRRMKLEQFLVANTKIDHRFVSRCAAQLFTKDYRQQHLFRTGTKDENKAERTSKKLVPEEFCEWFRCFINNHVSHCDWFTPDVVKNQCCSVFTKASDRKKPTDSPMRPGPKRARRDLEGDDYSDGNDDNVVDCLKQEIDYGDEDETSHEYNNTF